MKFFHRLLPLILIIMSCSNNDLLYKSDTFIVKSDGVRQGKFKSIAKSSTELYSNYKSPYKRPTCKVMEFKFAINGGDNERYPGENHHILLNHQNAKMVSALYKFGCPDPPEAMYDEKERGNFLDRDVELTIRADMRHVLNAFKEKGFYALYNGETIKADDFKGVYLAGRTQPLSWEFANLAQRPEFMLRDTDGNGIYEISVNIQKFQQATENEMKTRWALKEDISKYPIYESGQLICDALYNMSLEELVLDIRKDGAFMAGAKWPGVWTRDISYSILLSLAILEPEAAKTSLIHKVKNNRIIQDTGTGGSWPVSSDRMTWALAAWEIYTVTGDRDWLEEAFEIIKNSAADDLLTVLNPATGLMYGESSFLDWREQTYPRWMDPKDIYMSHNLGTNAVHYETYVILSNMAKELAEKDLAEKYDNVANSLKTAINEHLWCEQKGYYGQYLYGRNYFSVSSRSEALGEALCVLFDIADSEKEKIIIENTPTTTFGIPCIYPQIPDIPPYHNNGIWPFVEAYWTWASAKVGNTKSVEHGLASIIRASSLFLTNKENMVAETGDFMGTEINSDRQLWSVAGNLAMVYRIFLGMDFQPDALSFKPFIPEKYAGMRSLKNFKYRKSLIDITIDGYGDNVQSLSLDGKLLTTNKIPGNISGHHKIHIQMNNEIAQPGNINLVRTTFSPNTPDLTVSDSLLVWNSIENAKIYRIFKNGTEISKTKDTRFRIPRSDYYSEYQVMAVGKSGQQSFLSQPVSVVSRQHTILMEANGEDISNDYPGFYGFGYIPISKQKNKNVNFPVYIPRSGKYALDFRYSNGNGPINTNNKCAVRSLFLNGKRIGAVVFPQRGDRNWTDWGYSNTIPVNLPAGDHKLALEFQRSDENMNFNTNAALLDQMRLILLKYK